MKLEDVLREIDKEQVVQIGAKSSFYFIGTSEEYFEDLAAINAYFGKRSKGRAFTPMEKRKVRNEYYNENGLVLLTTGGENGEVWFRDEYENILPRYRTAL